jgi:signal transduction histidine kinase
VSTGGLGELIVARPEGKRRSRAGISALESHGRYLGNVALLILVYYGAAHLGFALAFAGPVASIVWLPVGVGIAFLYVIGLGFWPGVVIGDLLVNNYSALPIGSAVGQTVGNLLEVLVAAILMRRLIGRSSQLTSLGHVLRMALAVAAGTAVSAVIGPLSLWLGGVIPAATLSHVARTWWLGDISGALIVVPLVLAWSDLRTDSVRQLLSLDAALPLAAVICVSALVCRTANPLSYLVFPPLMWAALQVGQRGVTLAVAIAAGFAVWATTHYIGPFHAHVLARSVLETQLFIAVASLSMLSLAAVVSEREQFAEGLLASRVRLVEAVDTERRRLESNLHDGAQLRLTALLIRVGLAEDEAEDMPESTRGLLARARAELSIVIDDLRQISHGKHPRVLTEQGLSRAIESLVAQSTTPIKLQGLPSERLHEATEATGYYVVSEAIANAERYARASRITVSVRVIRDVLELGIADDGVGGASEIDGHGLQGLKDRVETLGGTFALESPPGGGTRVTARVPGASTVQ